MLMLNFTLSYNRVEGRREEREGEGMRCVRRARGRAFKVYDQTSPPPPYSKHQHFPALSAPSAVPPSHCVPDLNLSHVTLLPPISSPHTSAASAWAAPRKVLAMAMPATVAALCI